MDTLVLVNSCSPAYPQGEAYVLPYLDHFGIPYTLWDIHRAPLPTSACDFALVVIAHPQMDPTGHQLSRTRLLEAVKAGTGLVTFDWMGLEPQPEINKLADTGSSANSWFEQTAGYQIIISMTKSGVRFTQPHPITARHSLGETIPLEKDIPIAVDHPILSTYPLDTGRIVQWATTEWMDTRFMGALGGLDDVLWRSLVWAARKPFALRGLPPLVTMRVDDVAGMGHLWGQSPLWWVHTANRYGFKPWLGVFPFNLTETAIMELRQLLLGRQATAFPHAFGRPLRTLTPTPYPDGNPTGVDGFPGDPCPYYDSSRFPLRAKIYDEFIYYDHEHQCPWSDSEASQGLAAVDTWYEEHAPLPISSYAIAHWGEMGSNTLAHMRDRWGCEFIATYHGVDAPLEGANWLVAGPFRKHEPPGSALFDRSNRGDRSVYYADFINFADRQFFLCCTEVRDETGYEWAPDGDADTSAARGLRQLKRALDSFALPVLFTHEMDYIYKISPQAWEGQLAQIAAGLGEYNPIFVTLDEGVRYVRATKTSRLASAAYDPESGEVNAHFIGRSDVLTHFHLFTSEEEISSRLVEVPPFENGIDIRCKA
jgi:hypothetical protein